MRQRLFLVIAREIPDDRPAIIRRGDHSLTALVEGYAVDRRVCRLSRRPGRFSVSNDHNRTKPVSDPIARRPFAASIPKLRTLA